MIIVAVITYPISLLLYLILRVFHLEAPLNWHYYGYEKKDKKWLPVRRGKGLTDATWEYSQTIGMLSFYVGTALLIVGWIFWQYVKLAFDGKWHNIVGVLLLISSFIFMLKMISNSNSDSNLAYWIRFAVGVAVFATVVILTWQIG